MRIRRSFLLRIALLALLGGMSACTQIPAAQEETPRTATPLFWRATSPEGRVAYLLGSIHVGPAGGWTYPQTIEAAFSEATDLYVEFDARAFTELAQATLLAQYGALPPGVHLRDRLAPPLYAELVTALEASQFYEEDVGRLRPWMIANMLSLEAAIKVGLSPAYGVDSGLLARSQGKRVIELESAELQFAALADIDEEAESEALAETLALGEQRGENATALADAWSKGDETHLTHLLYEGLDDSPASRRMFEAMVFSRNEGMAARVLSEITQADPAARHFVVVGAAHFVGERNIRDLLEAEGYRVERVDAAGR
jgi:uncharacterized protein YbaP (TraB family)